MPLRLPTNTREPTTDTCNPDADTPGTPKAHFSCNLGTSVALSPAAAAGWNRVLRASTPHPFQLAPARGALPDSAAQ